MSEESKGYSKRGEIAGLYNWGELLESLGQERLPSHSADEECESASQRREWVIEIPRPATPQEIERRKQLTAFYEACIAYAKPKGEEG